MESSGFGAVTVLIAAEYFDLQVCKINHTSTCHSVWTGRNVDICQIACVRKWLAVQRPTILRQIRILNLVYAVEFNR